MKTKIFSAIIFILIAAYARGEDFGSVPDLPLGGFNNSGFEGINGTDNYYESSFPYMIDFKLTAASTEDKYRRFASGKGGLRIYGTARLTDNLTNFINVNSYTNFIENRGYNFNKHTLIKLQEFGFSANINKRLKFNYGRINVRNGVSTGYNPTDWFKAGSLVRIDSLDSQDRREDRLGVVTIETMYFMDRYTFVAGYKPHINTEDNSILSNHELIGLDLNKTNATDSIYARFNIAGGNVDLTLSGIYDWRKSENYWGTGAELSFTVLSNLIVYGEWFGGRRENLAMTKKRYLNQTAAGFSLSLPEIVAGNENIAWNMEHHFNDAGVIRRSSLSDLEYRLLLKNASEHQEPAAKHQVFTRFSWTEINTSRLSLSLIGVLVPTDGSGFAQIGLTAKLNDNLKADLSSFFYYGGEKSFYKSSPVLNNVFFSLTYSM